MTERTRIRIVRGINPIAAGGVLVAVYAVIAAIIAFRRYAGDIGAPIVWPLVALFTVFGLFLLLLRARQKGPLRFLEIGIFFAGFLLLYGAWPMIELTLNGFVYTEVSEDRVRGFGATPAQIAVIGWWYVILLASFCAAYLLVRQRDRLAKPVLKAKPDIAFFISVVAALGLAILIRFFFGTAFDLSGSTYAEGFLKVQQLPTIARQLFSQIFSDEQTFRILLITAIAAHYRRTRWLLAVVMIGLVVFNLARPGARGEMMLLTVAAAQMYDLFVRRVSAKWIAVGAVAGFVLFAALAYVRQGKSAGTLSFKQAILSANEFDAMYGTAFDLKYVRGDSGVALRWPALYWADLTALVPQQLLPFEKTSPSIWYVTTYYKYYADTGGAYAFGAVPEAVIGAGWIELVWRGAVIGIVFALMHRRLFSRPVSFTFVALYVFITVWSYQSIRGSSFYLLSITAFKFVVPILAVHAVAYLLRGRRRTIPAAAASGAPA